MNILKVKCKNFTKIKTNKLLIVIHWAACTGRQAVYWFTCPGNKVSSAHYVIDKKGNVTQLVDEKYIAWHAGYSSLKDYPTILNNRNWMSLNVCSIGIEIAGPPMSINKQEKIINKWTGWPEQEIQALIQLCKEIKIRWPNIKLTDHSTISPGRKTDVKKGKGIDKFPWERLLNETEIKEA